MALVTVLTVTPSGRNLSRFACGMMKQSLPWACPASSSSRRRCASSRVIGPPPRPRPRGGAPGAEPPGGLLSWFDFVSFIWLPLNYNSAWLLVYCNFVQRRQILGILILCLFVVIAFLYYGASQLSVISNLFQSCCLGSLLLSWDCCVLFDYCL